MIIRTLNRNERITKKELKTATEFMLRLLIRDKSVDKLDITIESKDVMWGIDTLSEIYPDNSNPCKYKIDLYSRISRKNQLLSLAHEFVHIKQFFKRELGTTREWCGNEYTKWCRKEYNETQVEYWDRPWEIEAYGREYGLWKRYDNFIKSKKIKYQ